MCRDRVFANYLQLKYKDQNKGATMYIEERPKETWNIARFINNTQPRSTNKQHNCIFERHEGNHVFCMFHKINSYKGRVVDQLQFESNGFNRFYYGSGKYSILPNL